MHIFESQNRGRHICILFNQHIYHIHIFKHIDSSRKTFQDFQPCPAVFSIKQRFGTQALHGRCTRSTSRAFSPGTYWWHETDPSHWCGNGSQSGGSGECLGVLEETCDLKGHGLGCSFTRDIYIYLPLFPSLKFCKASNCLFSFVSNLVNFSDSTEYKYIYIYKYI